jgi:hypothetical protein
MNGGSAREQPWSEPGIFLDGLRKGTRTAAERERLPNTVAEIYRENNMLVISEVDSVSSGGHDMQRVLVC